MLGWESERKPLSPSAAWRAPYRRRWQLRVGPIRQKIFPPDPRDAVAPAWRGLLDLLGIVRARPKFSPRIGIEQFGEPRILCQMLEVRIIARLEAQSGV